MKFIAEIRHFLSGWLPELRAQRAHAAALEVATLQDIAADAERDAAALGQTAFRARVLDDEGLALIARITAPDSPGGALIVRAEVPQLRRAVRCITRSRDLDHALTEGLSPAPTSTH